MATDKLVDFDHVTDYISREAAIALAKDLVLRYEDGTTYKHRCIDPQCIRELPAADVRPVAEISDAVYEAMYFLNSVSAQMPYHVYSALFDLILGILPTCGADMREPNLDTTKGERRDELSG